MPLSDNEAKHQLRLDRLLAEYYRRMDAGESVDRDTILRDHPEFADELKDLLETAALVDDLVGPLVEGNEA